MTSFSFESLPWIYLTAGLLTCTFSIAQLGTITVSHVSASVVLILCFGCFCLFTVSDVDA